MLFSWWQSEPTDRNVESSSPGLSQNQHSSTRWFCKLHQILTPTMPSLRCYLFKAKFQILFIHHTSFIFSLSSSAEQLGLLMVMLLRKMVVRVFISLRRCLGRRFFSWVWICLKSSSSFSWTDFTICNSCEWEQSCVDLQSSSWPFSKGVLSKIMPNNQWRTNEKKKINKTNKL